MSEALEKKSGKDNKILEEFVRRLTVFELDNPGQYTKFYEKLIEEYSEKWSENDED